MLVRNASDAVRKLLVFIEWERSVAAGCGASVVRSTEQITLGPGEQLMVTDTLADCGASTPATFRCRVVNPHESAADLALVEVPL